MKFSNSRDARLASLMLMLVLVLPSGRAPRAEATDTGVDVAGQIARLGLEESATAVRDLPGWKPPQRILVWNVEPALLPSLQSVAPGVTLVAAADASEGARLAAGADAVLGFCSAEILEAAPTIRWIQTFACLALLLLFFDRAVPEVRSRLQQRILPGGSYGTAG